MHQWLDKIAGARVLVIGDVMLDRYYFADVTRISPEGPVPVAQVKETENMLGGAANVAHNLARLGCKVSVAGISGDDENRRILDHKFNALGIGHAGLLKIPRPTTTKVRVIGGHQQMIRLDFEDAGRIVRSVEQRLTAYLLRQMDVGLDAVILSDYAKGVCVPGLCRKVIQACRECRIPLVVDPKGDQWQKYKGAFLVTPNVKELSEVSHVTVCNEDKNIVALGSAIRQRFGFDSLMVTRSEQGISLISDGEPIHIPTYAQEVFDVTGAGDTVIAVSSLCLAAGVPTLAACIIANYAAGIVVGEVGASAVSKEELEAAVAKHQTSLVSAW